MGDIVEEPVKEVNVRVRVADSDETDVIAKIELFEDGDVAQVYNPDKQAICWLAGCTPAPNTHYYFVKVTQADGNLLWPAPISVTVAEKQPARISQPCLTLTLTIEKPNSNERNS